MPNIKPVIVPGKALKGGRHKVRISVSHNGDYKYITTDIVLNSEREFSRGLIVKRPDASLLNSRLLGIINGYHDTISRVGSINGLSCSELVWLLQNGGQQKHTLTSIYEEYAASRTITESSAQTYKTQVQWLTQAMGRDIDIKTLLPTSVMATTMRLHQMRLSQMTIRNTLMMLKMLINYARKMGYVDYAIDPFINLQLPQQTIRQSWLTIDQMRTIRDCSLKGAAAEMRDLFMLSFYLGGINLVDLLQVDFVKCGRVLKYERQKTARRTAGRAVVEVEMPAEALAIIKRYVGADGRLAMRYKHLRHEASGLRMIIAQTGIPHLIFYSARKTFAQTAFNIGVDSLTIDYLLGHSLSGSGSCLFFYMRVTPEKASEALRLVVDELNKK